MPAGEERRDRLASVMEVIYLIFNEGYAATAGDDLIRLCYTSSDFREGMEAFLGKRTPNWQGK